MEKGKPAADETKSSDHLCGDHIVQNKTPIDAVSWIWVVRGQQASCVTLLAGLNLVVPCHYIGIAGRHIRILVTPTNTSVLLLSAIALGPSTGRPRLSLGLALDHVHDPARLSLAIGQALVLVVVLIGELGDDVPCVQQTRDEAEDAKQDVNDGVSRADTALDPYYLSR